MRNTVVSSGYGVLCILFCAAAVWSGVHPADRFTWFLETFPAYLGLGIVLLTARHFPLTPLAYGVLFVEAMVLFVGGHYTYADVPFFNELRDTFMLGRNHYDRVGHFMQGVTPAIVAREIILRKRLLPSGPWLWFFVLCVCLSVSALYELLEFAVACWTGSAAAAFLGAQGDVWDTQWDMTMALLGATVALLCFSRWHDRQLQRLL